MACWPGTTGRPKASVLTHGQMAFVVNNHLADLMPGMTPRDASLVLAPLSHGAGVHLLMQVARGVKSILPEGERFDAEQAWRLVAECPASRSASPASTQVSSVTTGLRHSRLP